MNIELESVAGLGPPPAPFAVERALARGAIGGLLVRCRKALATWPHERGEVRGAAVRDFVLAVRGVLDNSLRRNRRVHETPFPALIGRIADRLEALRQVLGPVSDDSYRLLLLQADFHAVGGDLDAAMRCLTHGIDRRHFVQSYLLRDALVLRFIDLALALGQEEAAARAGVRDLLERRQIRTLGLDWMDRLEALRAQAGRLTSPALRAAVQQLRGMTWIASRRPRRLTLPLASVYLRRVVLGRMRRALATEQRMRDAGPPVVVRAMGGVGDLMMMTPGLRALARRAGQPIDVLVPARLVPVFETNPDIRAACIEDLPEAWQPPPGTIDMTDCPAVVGELAELPHVRTDRVVLLARGLGVGPDELDRTGGRLPIFEPTPTSNEAAEQWLRVNGLTSKRFVAVQARAAETYKSWPHIAAAAAEIAKFAPVVVLDEADLPGFDFPGVSKAFGLDLGTALAIGCRASVIVCTDSSFLHLAGARRIPSVAVLGPTAAEARTNLYSEARAITQAERFACSPCWRNEFTPCRVSMGMRSLCLDTLAPGPVVEAVRASVEGRDG